MKKVGDRELLTWLASRAPDGGGVTGYNAGGWEASVWIPHAMYETAELPVGMSHDDVHRIERVVGVVSPELIDEGESLDDVLADATAVGSTLGRSESPGPGWQRLLWSELGSRLGVDPFVSGAPSDLSFPYPSWPVTITPPAEGSLDREQFLRLTKHLAATTPEGERTRCIAFYAMAAAGEFDEPVLYRGGLGELSGLYDDEELPGSPSNIWPDNKSWFVYTDWDLWGTKISGSPELINRLTADLKLETVKLSF